MHSANQHVPKCTPALKTVGHRSGSRWRSHDVSAVLRNLARFTIARNTTSGTRRLKPDLDVSGTDHVSLGKSLVRQLPTGCSATGRQPTVKPRTKCMRLPNQKQRQASILPSSSGILLCSIKEDCPVHLAKCLNPSHSFNFLCRSRSFLVILCIYSFVYKTTIH